MKTTTTLAAIALALALPSAATLPAKAAERNHDRLPEEFLGRWCTNDKDYSYPCDKGDDMAKAIAVTQEAYDDCRFRSVKRTRWPAPDLDDTQLGESSLSLELHRAQIPDRRVPSL